MSKSEQLNSDFDKIGNFQRLFIWLKPTKFRLEILRTIQKSCISRKILTSCARLRVIGNFQLDNRLIFGSVYGIIAIDILFIACHYFVSGVLSRKNFFLLCHGNMSVNLSCGDGAVPQQFLDIAYIDVLLKKKRRERMSEHKWSNMYIAFYK